MKKEKENLIFFTKRRIFLSLVFLVFAFGFFNFTNFSGSNKFLVNVERVRLANAQQAKTTLEENSKNVLGGGWEYTGETAKVIKKAVIDPVVDFTGDAVLWAINEVLKAIFKLVLAIVSIAAILFDWSVDAKIFGLVMGLDAIKMGWTMVRDLLNMFFILVLLFSAFCTILQIEKYNIKKILLNLIIMALLVNFSFPIARFIIDAANVPMYYFFSVIAKSMGGNSISAIIMKNSGGDGLQGLMTPPPGVVGGELTLSLIAAIVFTFIFGMTLLIIAALLLIRIVVLALLIIFAPVGFAAAILPGTKIASYASEWWDALFKQSFFGTIMAFVLYIAVFMMGQMASITQNLKDRASTAGASAFDSIVAAGLSLSFPIIILWVGIMMAQKGAVGASAVSKKVTGWGKWAGNLPWRGTKALAGATGIPGGIKQRYGEIKDSFKSSRESREARFAARLGSKSAEERDIKKRAEEYKKNKSDAEMFDLAKRGDAAAAYALADSKKIDQETYDKFSKANKNPRIKKAFEDKVKQNRADLVATNKANDPNSKEYKDILKANPAWATTPNLIQDELVEIEMGRLTAEKLAEQDWVSIADDSKFPPGPDKNRVIGAMASAIGHLAGPAKAELQKRLSGANRAAINKMAGLAII